MSDFAEAFGWPTQLSPGAIRRQAEGTPREELRLSIAVEVPF